VLGAAVVKANRTPLSRARRFLPTGGLGRGALALPAVDLGLNHPAAHGLLADTDLPGCDRRSSPERGVRVCRTMVRYGILASSRQAGPLPVWR
jgi:hypothetical protein